MGTMTAPVQLLLLLLLLLLLWRRGGLCRAPQIKGRQMGWLIVELRGKLFMCGELVHTHWYACTL
jgi:hypothetical protein